MNLKPSPGVTDRYAELSKIQYNWEVPLYILYEVVSLTVPTPKICYFLCRDIFLHIYLNNLFQCLVIIRTASFTVYIIC